MGSRLYVGNLPFNVDEAQLRDFFAQAGHAPTEVTVITDRETGRSRGFGFVTVASREAMEAAAKALNGAEFAGRALTVNEAKEKTGGGTGGGRGGRGGNRW